MSNLHGSYTKFNGSWRPNDSATSLNNSWHKEDKAEDNNPCPWSAQEMMTGRPDDYVGGYSPAWIHAYRQRQEAKKTIKINGYNATKK